MSIFYVTKLYFVIGQGVIQISYTGISQWKIVLRKIKIGMDSLSQTCLLCFISPSFRPSASFSSQEVIVFSA